MSHVRAHRGVVHAPALQAGVRDRCSIPNACDAIAPKGPRCELQLASGTLPRPIYTTWAILIELHNAPSTILPARRQTRQLGRTQRQASAYTPHLVGHLLPQRCLERPLDAIALLLVGRDNPHLDGRHRLRLALVNQELAQLGEQNGGKRSLVLRTRGATLTYTTWCFTVWCFSTWFYTSWSFLAQFFPAWFIAALEGSDKGTHALSC